MFTIEITEAKLNELSMVMDCQLREMGFNPESIAAARLEAEERKNRTSQTWDHRPECTKYLCYCACSEDDEPDPICDCGRPAWACCCEP